MSQFQTAPKIDLEGDKRFVEQILNGDEEAWSYFVEKYTDWVFHCARHFTFRKTGNFSKYGKTESTDSGNPNIQYNDEVADAYLWIFQQLRKKLKHYTGKCPLSVYIWMIVNTNQKPHYLKFDYYTWRYGKVSYIPQVLQEHSETLQHVFKCMRMKKSEEEIARKLRKDFKQDFDVEQVAAFERQVREILFKEGLDDLVHPPEEAALEPNMPGDEEVCAEDAMLLNKVGKRYLKSLRKLSREQILLLKFRHDKNMSPGTILNVYQRIGLNLPGKVQAQAVTVRKVYKMLERIKEQLLHFFCNECQDLSEVTINKHTLNTFLEQLGVDWS